MVSVVSKSIVEIWFVQVNTYTQQRCPCATIVENKPKVLADLHAVLQKIEF